MTRAAFRRILRMAFADWTEHEPREEEIAYYWKIATKYDGYFDNFTRARSAALYKGEIPIDLSDPKYRPIIRAANQYFRKKRAKAQIG